MAKKGKDEVPNPNSVANRDIIQRLNFLYQASVYLHTIPGPAPSTSTAAPEKNAPRTKQKRKTTKKVTSGDLAKAYIACMKTVGQKTTVKIDPAVKRTLCAGCNTTLLPGCTVSVRVKKSASHGNMMVYTCNDCKTSRRIPAPPTLAPNLGLQSQARAEQDSAVGESGAGLAYVPMVGVEASGRKRKRKVRPRVPPLFARDVGHVVFCGNEKLPQPEPGQGNGIYIA